MTDQPTAESLASAAPQRQAPRGPEGNAARGDEALGEKGSRDSVYLDQFPSADRSTRAPGAQSAVPSPQAKKDAGRSEGRTQSAVDDNVDNLLKPDIVNEPGAKATVYFGCCSVSSSSGRDATALGTPRGSSVPACPQSHALPPQGVGHLPSDHTLPSAASPTQERGVQLPVPETALPRTASLTASCAKEAPERRCPGLPALAASPTGAISFCAGGEEKEGGGPESVRERAVEPERASPMSAARRVPPSSAAFREGHDSALSECRSSVPRAIVGAPADALGSSVNGAYSGAAEPTCVPEPAIDFGQSARTEPLNLSTCDTAIASAELSNFTSQPPKYRRAYRRLEDEAAQRPYSEKREAAKHLALVSSENREHAEMQPGEGTAQALPGGQKRDVLRQRDESGEGSGREQRSGSERYASSALVAAGQHRSSAADGRKCSEQRILECRTENSSPGCVPWADRADRVQPSSALLNRDSFAPANDSRVCWQATAGGSCSPVMTDENILVGSSSCTHADHDVPAARAQSAATAVPGGAGLQRDLRRSTKTDGGELFPTVVAGERGFSDGIIELEAAEGEGDGTKMSVPRGVKRSQRETLEATRDEQAPDEREGATRGRSIGVNEWQSTDTQLATLLRSDIVSSAHDDYSGGIKNIEEKENGGRESLRDAVGVQVHQPPRKPRRAPSGTPVGNPELRPLTGASPISPTHSRTQEKNARDSREQQLLSEGLSDFSDGTDLDNDAEVRAARLAVLSSRERIPVGRVAALKMKLERRLEKRKQVTGALGTRGVMITSCRDRGTTSEATDLNLPCSPCACTPPRSRFGQPDCSVIGALRLRLPFARRRERGVNGSSLTVAV